MRLAESIRSWLPGAGEHIYRYGQWGPSILLHVHTHTRTHTSCVSISEVKGEYGAIEATYCMDRVNFRGQISTQEIYTECVLQPVYNVPVGAYTLSRFPMVSPAASLADCAL